MTTLSDALLEHHAENYIARRIGAHGVSFEQYLTDPAHFDALALEHEPLLPAQRAVGEAWAGQITHVPYHLADHGHAAPYCCDD